jgi:HEAT repeat protein
MLIRLGDDALKRLLDLLREQTDSNERVRIMRLVISAGRRALPLVRDRIHKDQSWYVLRNIAYILAHIGDESSAKALQPLLLHENSKVRLEALKSINRTGKNERSTLLLAALPQADHKFMLNIIDVLGNAKCTEAAATLIGFFETSPISNKSLRADMEEKICNALGLIGSPDAIPLLVKIVESKSFLGISRYPEKVKVAAGKALASLKKRS